MDTNDATQNPKMKTEDYFPGTSGAWSNAWCMDSHTLTTDEDERHSDYQDHDDPDSGWEPATS